MLKTSMTITPAPAKFAALLFAGEWERGIGTALELGYDAIELSLRDPKEPVVSTLVKTLESKAFPIANIGTGPSYYSDGLALTRLDDSIQAKLYERITGFIDIMAPYRGLVTIGGVRGNLTGAPETWSTQRHRMAEAVRCYADYARPLGVRLAIEPINRYETNLIHTVGEALEFIQEVGADNLVVLADTFHMNIEEVALPDALRQAGKQLGFLHFSDSNRLAAGHGHIDFESLVGVLREINYTGYMSAEILPMPDSRTAAQWAIETFRRIGAGA